jgi:hypothetical protein
MSASDLQALEARSGHHRWLAFKQAAAAAAAAAADELVLTKHAAVDFTSQLRYKPATSSRRKGRLIATYQRMDQAPIQ